MQPDVWYKASDLMNVLGVRETRTKELLRALITDEKLVDDGATKGKRYKKADESERYKVGESFEYRGIRENYQSEPEG